MLPAVGQQVADSPDCASDPQTTPLLRTVSNAISLITPTGKIRAIAFSFPMIYEWPHPQIDTDWDSGAHQWREITSLAYQELRQIPLLHVSSNAFMQSEPVDILSSGEGLYVCCRRAGGHYFDRLLPGSSWAQLEQLPLPEVGALKL